MTAPFNPLDPRYQRDLNRIADAGNTDVNLGKPYSGGLLGKMFGTGRPDSRSGLIPENLLRDLHSRSLLSMGLGILQNSRAGGPGGLAGIAGGIQAGQDSFDSGLATSHRERAIAQQQGDRSRIETLRTTIAEKYPTPAKETPQEKVQRLTAMAVEYAQGGDHETAAKLVQVANALRMAGGSGQYTYMQNNGVIYQIDKATGDVRQVEENDLPKARLAISKARLGLSQRNTEISGERLRLAEEAAARPGEGERKSALLLTLASTVAPVLNDSPAPSRKAWAAARTKVGEGLTAREQQFYSAANSFMDAYVRETSGAAINPGELDRAWRTYIPEPGDKKAQLIYKKQLRDQFMLALNAKAFRAGLNLDLDGGDAGGADAPGDASKLDE